MDGADLRLMFILGLVTLAIGIALVAWAAERVVTGWRVYTQTPAKRATQRAPVAPREAPPAVASREAGAVATTALTSTRRR